MAYRRPVRYAPGETLVGCSICGFPYLYPSELIYADDKQFYCTRTCWNGKTVLQDTRETAEAQRRRDEDPPRALGPKPSWR